MGFNLLSLILPRENRFFDLLLQQSANLLEGCQLFKRSIELDGEKQQDEQLNYFALVKECERRGDLLEQKILDELNDAFITPIDREDIHDIVTEIDTALDILNGTARKLEIYSIRTIPQNIRKFTEIIVAIVGELGNLINLLKSKKPMQDSIALMHKLENDADELFHQCMLQLFSNGSSAVEIVKMKEIYERLESVVDVVDRMGKMIRSVKCKIG